VEATTKHIPKLQKRFESLRCCVLIPTYNNSAALKNVIDSVLEYTTSIVVVNDGSTDSTKDILSNYTFIPIQHHSKNLGKGKALQTGFSKGVELGYDYAISIDSDGQHLASDLEQFLDALEQNKNAIIIGNRNMNVDHVPTKSNFGKRFSNFWFKVETGKDLPDTQSGYRLYPIKQLANKYYFSTKFEFEIEIIVRAVWKGMDVISVPVKVYYAPPDERVSHFRPFKDFTRISILNTCLVTIALLWYYPYLVVKNLSWSNLKQFITIHFIKPEEPVLKKSIAIGFGVFMGIIPLWGFQMLIAFALAHYFRLNKAIVLIASNISIPPMIPFLIFCSYYTGSILLNTPIIPDFDSFHTLEQIKESLLTYIVGSTVFATLAGCVSFGISYIVLKNLSNK
jgi:glycosyltransferase involved in cell wall biosynthesis